MSIRWGEAQSQDERWMRLALAQAQRAEQHGEVPVGAVLVIGEHLVAVAHNQPISSCDPTAHAEVVALRLAAHAQHNYRLPQATLYVSLEPCLMCLGAMMHARIQRLVFAANEPRAGVLISRSLALDFFNHHLQVTSGVLSMEGGALLRLFFQKKRRLNSSDNQ
jgi:tRNA(adenine34) deaminase